jgi:hypothetical protein
MGCVCAQGSTVAIEAPLLGRIFCRSPVIKVGEESESEI